VVLVLGVQGDEGTVAVGEREAFRLALPSRLQFIGEAPSRFDRHLAFVGVEGPAGRRSATWTRSRRSATRG
jgi:hypothetical protein